MSRSKKRKKPARTRKALRESLRAAKSEPLPPPPPERPPLPELSHAAVRYAADYRGIDDDGLALAGTPVVRSPDRRIGVWLHPEELWLIAEGLYETEWETPEEEQRALALMDHLEGLTLEVDPLDPKPCPKWKGRRR